MISAVDQRSDDQDQLQQGVVTAGNPASLDTHVLQPLISLLFCGGH
jgi:hypothetical protein